MSNLKMMAFWDTVREPLAFLTGWAAYVCACLAIQTFTGVNAFEVFFLGMMLYAIAQMIKILYRQYQDRLQELIKKEQQQ